MQAALYLNFWGHVARMEEDRVVWRILRWRDRAWWKEKQRDGGGRAAKKWAHVGKGAQNATNEFPMEGLMARVMRSEWGAGLKAKWDRLGWGVLDSWTDLARKRDVWKEAVGRLANGQWEVAEEVAGEHS